MPQIRPVSDLRNNFAEIAKIVHETNDPVFLTKNGYGNMVVMSIPAYEKMMAMQEVYLKLKEAEMEALSSEKRYSHDEVIKNLRTRVADKASNYDL